MSEYIVRISAVAADGSKSETGRSITARIEIADGEAHVVEFTVRSPIGSDLAPRDLPFVDLEKLALAFTGGDTPLVAPRAPVTSAQHPSARSPVRKPKRRPTSPNTEARHAATSRGEIPSARAYRRMPDPESLQDVYAKVGSIASVARHYGVPSHTAQGWIGRLRRLRTALAGDSPDE